MSDLLDSRLALLDQPAHRALLARRLHGIEKESLRVDAQGHLALTPHPVALGSALTHPGITTDYSEALLELITGTHAGHESLFQELRDIHRFVYGELGGELLWNQSMPCGLPPEKDIPIAWFGSSSIGMLKHVYRRGLAYRYGKAMQCIAGIHYNFSYADDLWPLLAGADEPAGISATDRQSAKYVALIRNFNRYSWLLMYLFGASPALSVDFLQGRPHQLEQLDPRTLYLPYATSLRMSDLGYQNKAQAGLKPCYNDLSTYLARLYEAVSTPWPEYEKIGTIRDGQWVQLNTNILQIENEYYSSIRPKRVARSGERPLRALAERGVQYVEVRCMDIDPFLPVGMDETTSRFLDAFLLYCTLDDSPLFPEGGHCTVSANNFLTVVKQGRQPGLTLNREGREVGLRAWATELLDRISACADLLDRVHGETGYSASVMPQRAKVEASELTPSARVLDALRTNGMSFQEFMLDLSRRHAADFLSLPCTPEQLAAFRRQAADSLAQQRELERVQTGDFSEFVAAYQAGLPAAIAK
ncbi:MAG: glutamate--cysteine ligase [Pigmentiphaga sp.]|uniref:glutamate--cysteine ligase n=1 Tax=Pigmentiphaga sp. TaxID=1977564 RepID=UPI0029ADD4F2|nr:glutamate--cysteine ligase [Pigmentiphaga sp.]MDX3907707.1 glutamate--cysteine ligase [Pigmentiphaga sp.]